MWSHVYFLAVLVSVVELLSLTLANSDRIDCLQMRRVGADGDADGVVGGAVHSLVTQTQVVLDVAGAVGVAPGLVRLRINGDCNDNGVPDSCDLADGTEADLDGDGFIDACRAFPLPDLFRRGDINGNGTVEPLIDAIALLEWVFVDGPAPPCSDAADVDDNGSNATLTDVIALVEWGFQNGPPPPAPGPTDCGPDPTDDLLECEELPTCP